MLLLMQSLLSVSFSWDVFFVFRLASLSPSAVMRFNVSWFLLVKDAVWTEVGFQIIIKCAKEYTGFL